MIKNNFILSIFQSISFLAYALLSYKIHPIKILKVKFLIFFPVILFSPYLLRLITSPGELLLFQCFIIIFGITDVPAAAVFMAHFPILKRFTSASLLYAFSRILVYLLTSFGFATLTTQIGHWGVWLLMTPLCVLFGLGVYYFERREGLNQGKGLCEQPG